MTLTEFLVTLVLMALIFIGIGVAAIYQVVASIPFEDEDVNE